MLTVMHLRWQNLNDDLPTCDAAGQRRRPGSGLRHGRAWLRSSSAGPDGLLASWEWSFGHDLGCSIAFKVGGEGGGWAWTIAVRWLFYLHLRLAFLPTPKALRYGPSREISLCEHDGSIWWTVWRDWKDGWSRDVPRWRDGNFSFVDFLLGKVRHETVLLEERDVLIPMPEGSYPARCKMVERVWHRSRWPSKRWRCGEVELPRERPIPIPGKGENSYDCGEDALYSQSAAARTPAEAVANVVRSALEARDRYGGRGWKPEVARKAEA